MATTADGASAPDPRSSSGTVRALRVPNAAAQRSAPASARTPARVVRSVSIGSPFKRRANSGLRYAALLYAIGLALHTADHFRRGTDVITPQVYWAGMLSTVAALIGVGLALLEAHPAPLVAVGVGFTNAIGIGAVHLLPRWSAFSDAFPGSAVDSQSWAAVLFEIAAAVLFGVAGIYAHGNGQTGSQDGA